MWFGHKLGCHQKPERSFIIKGRQFPVCARCAGVYAGGIIAFITFRLMTPPIWLVAVFCAVMFSDWLIQFLKIRESTNLRRFITGFFCGYGLMNLQIRLLFLILKI